MPPSWGGSPWRGCLLLEGDLLGGGASFLGGLLGRGASLEGGASLAGVVSFAGGGGIPACTEADPPCEQNHTQL